MKKLLCWLVAVFWFVGAADTVRAQEAVTKAVQVYDANGKVLAEKLDMPKGVTVTLQARSYDANGKETTDKITWTVDPPSVATMDTSADGTLARVTMKRDLFDDPKQLEPWTNVRACVRDNCRWVFVTGILNMAGKWDVEIDVTNSFLGIGDERKTMNFVQTGRHLTITGVGKKPMTATIRGRSIDFVDPNRKLVKFSGMINKPNVADGTWASKAGYEGFWHAKR